MTRHHYRRQRGRTCSYPGTTPGRHWQAQRRLDCSALFAQERRLGIAGRGWITLDSLA